MENWNDILYKAFNSDVNKFLTSLYLIVWIFIGNWIFLNLFLAILLDGFAESNTSETNNYLDNDEDLQDDDEVVDKAKESNLMKNTELNEENLLLLNEDYNRMDTDEMDELE